MCTNDVNNQYAAYMERRTQMVDLLDKSRQVVSKLEMSQYKQNLEEMSRKVHNDNFKVMVVGTFKNGKSTFINSLLGEEVLPAYSIPCTAVINEVKYGEEKRAILHFRNPLPTTLPQQLAKRAAEHIEAHKNEEQIPPIEIPYAEIEDYVVIPMGMDASEMLLESPYEKVELFWPLELLKNGVEIVDSPGLNENETRTRVTMDYLAKADAILMVLNATTLCSATEMSFIEYDLYGQGFMDPFFVVNRFDCIPKREQEMVKKFASAKLKEYTSFGNDGIYYVSALDALDGKLEKDTAKYVSSGMAEFEYKLSEFLTQNRGKAKLAQPARELKRVLNEEALFKVIPLQRKLLSSSLEEVEKRYEALKPRLNDLRVRRDQLRSKLDLRIEQSKMEFRRVASRNLIDMVDNVPIWVNDYTPTTRIGINPLKAKERVAEMVKEVAEYLQSQVQEHQADWRTEVLTPLAEEKINSIFENSEADVTSILSAIDEIHVEIAGEEATISDVPVWQRIVGAIGGLALISPGAAIAGGINGIGKEMAKTVALDIGLGLLLGALGWLNPFTAIASILAIFVINVHDGESNITKKVKEAVIKQAQEALADHRENNISAVVESVGKSFSEIADGIVKGLDVEIDKVDEQMKAIIKELNKGQEQVDKKEEELVQCEKSIQDLSIELDELIFQLVRN